MLVQLLVDSWVYQPLQKPEILRYTPRLTPFDQMAQLDPADREAYPATIIATAKKNTQSTISNNIMKNYKERLCNPHTQLCIIKYIILVLLCLVPNAEDVVECDNAFFLGEEKATPNSTKRQRTEFQHPLIDRIAIPALQMRVNEVAVMESMRLQYYLQCISGGTDS
jgi:hypothetical protein